MRAALIALLLFGGTLAALFIAGEDTGISRDESFYVHAARQQAEYFRAAFEDPSLAFDKETIDKAYRYNREHPALMKNLFALSLIAHEELDLFPTEIAAHRFPAMVIAALLVALIYLSFRSRVGELPALFSAIAFITMPRVFYHSQLNCFDIPIVFFIFITSMAYLKSFESKWWAALTGVFFGLALATKHNSWALPIIFGIHYACVVYTERSRRARQKSSEKTNEEAQISLFPRAFLAMAILGPIIFFVHWPYLYHDTFQRIGFYINFHLRHDFYNMAYFGVTYFQPPFPISYPFVMMLFTIPLTLSALLVLGIYRAIPEILPAHLRARLFRLSSGPRDPQLSTLLFFGLFFAPLVIIALPHTPIFGGTKHFMPAYPFLVYFAALGAASAIRVLWRFLPIASRRTRKAVTVSSFCLLLLPGAVETHASHPYGIAHYTYPALGTSGAAALGMNRQFWGHTTAQIMDVLVEALPEGGTVYPSDTTTLAFHMMLEDRFPEAKLRVVYDMRSADMILVHHEHHFAEVEFQAWGVTGSAAPYYVSTHEGVPIISVYDNRARRSRR